MLDCWVCCSWLDRVSGQTIRIKVIVENATIRSGPGLETEIISENIPVGTEFEAAHMTGDWYEIKYRNTLGVLVTGYIHKMYVETAAPKPSPKVEEPKKPAVPPAPVPRRVEPERKARPKGDFAIMGGMVSGSFLSESSTYSDQWSDGGLKSVLESGSIGHKIAAPPGLGVSFSYLFAGGFGIQVRYDFNLSRNLASGSGSTYAIAWEWKTASGQRQRRFLAGHGQLFPLPCQLGRDPQDGRRRHPHSLYSGRGFLLPRQSRGRRDTRLRVHLARMPLVSISTGSTSLSRLTSPSGRSGSTSGPGSTSGWPRGWPSRRRPSTLSERPPASGGCPGRGNIAGNNFPSYTWIVDQEFADQIADQVTPLEIKTSFLKAQLGIKFLF